MERTGRTRRVGITTTVPLEPFFSAGATPIDLNNRFMASEDPVRMIEESQVKGYPRNICTWIRGLYTAALDMDGVVGVVRGDCSNTESLLSTLSIVGIPVHPFSYPPERSRDDIEREISSLCEFLRTDPESAEGMADTVNGCRSLALEVDELRWKEMRVKAEEAHSVLLSTSDLKGDPEAWKAMVDGIIDASRNREGEKEGPRLGYVGVPPIMTDLFPTVERAGGNVVYFEVQRQFAMPEGGDWMDRYLEYTYPYSIENRLRDIREQIQKRSLDGLVHYVQSFCHRQIDDIIFREGLDIPILTLEGNLPGKVDSRTRIRLEAFLDVLGGEAL